jgi:methionine-rich copper-binding protein CopC
MKNIALLILALACLPLQAVRAHAHLQSSLPANGSVLAQAPARLELVFAEAATLTALVLEGPAAGEERKLGPLPDASAARLAVDLPPLPPGTYTVKYRVLSADNHVMAGSIRFTIGR